MCLKIRAPTEVRKFIKDHEGISRENGWSRMVYKRKREYGTRALDGAGNERSGWKKKYREESLTAFENALRKPSTVEAF